MISLYSCASPITDRIVVGLLELHVVVKYKFMVGRTTGSSEDPAVDGLAVASRGRAYAYVGSIGYQI